MDADEWTINRCRKVGQIENGFSLPQWFSDAQTNQADVRLEL